MSTPQVKARLSKMYYRIGLKHGLAGADPMTLPRNPVARDGYLEGYWDGSGQRAYRIANDRGAFRQYAD